jgi:hypothetical protein
MITVKMTKYQMQGYEEIENYRRHSIMVYIVDQQTSWRIGVRVGTPEGEDFILRFPQLIRTFDKPTGAFNCCYQMVGEAKAAIDKFIDG